MKTRLLLVMIVLIQSFTSCTKDHSITKSIDISAYQLLGKDTANAIIYLTLLNAYKMPETSNNDGAKANLYVCTLSNRTDSLFVFDTNLSVNKNFFRPESRNQGFVINEENIKQINVQSVNIHVPENFKLPTKIKYVFASLDQALD